MDVAVGGGDEVGEAEVNVTVAVTDTAAPETLLLQATRIAVTQPSNSRVPNCDLIFIIFPPNTVFWLMCRYCTGFSLIFGETRWRLNRLSTNCRS